MPSYWLFEAQAAFRDGPRAHITGREDTGGFKRGRLAGFSAPDILKSGGGFALQSFYCSSGNFRIVQNVPCQKTRPWPMVMLAAGSH